MSAMHAQNQKAPFNGPFLQEISQKTSFLLSQVLQCETQSNGLVLEGFQDQALRSGIVHDKPIRIGLG